MEYDESFESWLHNLEKSVDPCSIFPELCSEKMSSSSSSSLNVEISEKNQKERIDNHELADQTTPYHQSEISSLPFPYLDGNFHVGAEKILPDAEKNRMNYKMIERDAAMNNNKDQSEGDEWLIGSKKTALPLPQHIVVERKRRRELNQKFMSLSKVVPGNNKKKDRASILGEAVKYMEDLQDRIKKLEERNKKKVLESVVFVKTSSSSSSSSSPLSSSSSNHYYYRSHPGNNNDDINGDYRNPSYNYEEDEEIIEAKVIEKSVLIRVHCGNHHHHHHDEILPTLLSAISELHLIVLTANAIPFGNHIDITVIAQMGVNFFMKTKDIVHHLRLALPNFI